MSSVDPVRRLHAALKRFRGVAIARPVPCPFPETDPLVHLLVESFLLWEATTAQAGEALGRLASQVVDYNEMRVCFTEELAAMLGPRYPRVEERCARLRCALNDLFKREHGLSLAHLQSPGRKDARGYLDSLDGTPTYVSARVALLGLGCHTIPVDGRLVGVLAGAGCCAATDSCEAVSSWLERQFKPGEGPEAHGLLQAWSDSQGEASARKGRAKGTAEPRTRSTRGRARAKE